MAKSRVETFREYRKSIISEDEHLYKAQVETDLPSNEVKDSSIKEEEVIQINKIKQNNIKEHLLFLIPILTIIILLIIFGIRVF